MHSSQISFRIVGGESAYHLPLELLATSNRSWKPLLGNTVKSKGVMTAHT